MNPQKHLPLINFHQACVGAKLKIGHYNSMFAHKHSTVTSPVALNVHKFAIIFSLGTKLKSNKGQD